MIAAAEIACEQPDRLARAMGRHFGHKVPVELVGRVMRVSLAAGRFELEPDRHRLVVRASADGEEELGHVKRVAEDHLTRFARPEVIQIGWDMTSEQEGSARGNS